jgi:hypothetical protein
MNRHDCRLEGLARTPHQLERQGKNRSMKHTRIIVTHCGGPDALRVVEEECPEPKEFVYLPQRGWFRCHPGQTATLLDTCRRGRLP